MHTRALPVALAATLVACSGPSAPSGEAPPPDGAATTWYRDVLPVAQEHCLGCHNDEAPTFSMERWSEDLATRAPLIAQYTAAGIMPPWRPSPDCNRYHGERLLDADAIAVFAAWAADDGAEGDPADAPPPLPPLAELERVDRHLTLETAYTPAPPTGDVNDLRCFVLDPELGDDAMLVGFDVTPGERRVVHHVLLYSADGDELAALDATDPGPGYGCPGGPGASSARVIAGWVPGMPANHYPEGTGVPLAKDERLVMQIHYNTAQAGPLPDQSAVDLMLAEAAVEAPAQIFSIADHDFSIPPQTHGHTTTVEVDVPAAGTLWAAAPHMHLLGRQARVEVERANGDVACLVDIPSWSFDWQQFYFLADPAGLAVAPGDTIRFSCTWDNDTPEAVTWGDGTEDEMCITYLYATAK